MRRSDEMQLMHTFVTVAKLGSMSAASLELGLTKSTVMRQVMTLQKRLGCVLLEKSVHGCMPTPVGNVFRREAQELLTAYEKATAVSVFSDQNDRKTDGWREKCLGSKEAVKGIVHVSVPFTLGVTLLVPWITQFQRIYPNVLIDLSLTVGPEHLLPSACDIRFTHGDIPAERVKTVPFGRMLRCMVASPAYLDERGVPQKPEDLADHYLLGSQDLMPGSKILLRRGDEAIRVPYHTRLRLRDHSSSKSAVLAGAGIAVHALRHDVDEDLKVGKLVEVLPDWLPEPCPINILFPISHPVDPATRSFADFVKKRWREHPLLIGV